FENNRGSEVGAILIDGLSSPTISRCMFATNYGGSDGALEDQGDGAPLIVNSVFVGNRSGNQAGAIGHLGSAMQILNCTIANNYAQYSGGGIQNGDGGTLQILNTILWGNTQVVSASTISTETTQIATFGGPIVISNSCVQGLQTYAGN